MLIFLILVVMLQTLAIVLLLRTLTQKKHAALDGMATVVPWVEEGDVVGKQLRMTFYDPNPDHVAKKDVLIIGVKDES